MQEVLTYSAQRSWQPTTSVMVPMYNEAQELDGFHQRRLRTLAGEQNAQLVHVNHRSSDVTLLVIQALHRADDRIGLVSSSSNFGRGRAGDSRLKRATARIFSRIFNETKRRPRYLVEWYTSSLLKVCA